MKSILFPNFEIHTQIDLEFSPFTFSLLWLTNSEKKEKVFVIQVIYFGQMEELQLGPNYQDIPLVSLPLILEECKRVILKRLLVDSKVKGHA